MPVFNNELGNSLLQLGAKLRVEVSNADLVVFSEGCAKRPDSPLFVWLLEIQDKVVVTRVSWNRDVNTVGDHEPRSLA